jgi:hypothetical protein
VLRLAAPALALAAAGLADVVGAQTLAFYLLFAAVPAGAAATLDAFGALVDARADARSQTALAARVAASTLALALTVFTTALHAGAVFGAAVTSAGDAVLVAALLAAAAAAACASTSRERPIDAERLLDVA